MRHQLYEIILEVIKRFEKGISIEELMLSLDSNISRRTLQRYLVLLAKKGQLVVVGQGRGRHYRISATSHEGEKTLTGFNIPMDQESQETLHKVSRPIQMRTPATYNKKFLEDYEPNETFYLSESVRKKLRGIGQSQDEFYPSGTYANKVFHRLLIDLSWNSSRLEGNTYSLLETERLIESGQAAKGKNIIETQMILNHKAAIEFLISLNEQLDVNRYTILNLHTLLSDLLLADSAACGRLRSIPIGIEKSVYCPSAIPQLIAECFDLLISKAKRIEDPFEQAFFLMIQLPYLQPFDDVNKRTSRLAANIPLLLHKICPISFIDVHESMYVSGLLGIYELNRIDLMRDLFVWAYERSAARYAVTRKVLGGPDLFRLKYKNDVSHIVREIVLNCMDKMHAVIRIREYMLQIAEKADRQHFAEVIETELQNLHEGNISRYQLLLSEYEHWKKTWY